MATITAHARREEGGGHLVGLPVGEELGSVVRWAQGGMGVLGSVVGRAWAGDGVPIRRRFGAGWPAARFVTGDTWGRCTTFEEDKPGAGWWGDEAPRREDAGLGTWRR